MMTRAYNELYLEDAMRNMGAMLDYAVRECHHDIGWFYNLFITSGISEQVAIGNVRYIAGMSGVELANEVTRRTTDKSRVEAVYICDGDTPEYWAGWALAFYQWFSARSFEQLQRDGLSIEIVISLYPTHHEADLTKFAQTADAIIQEQTGKRPCSLKTLRKEAHLTQQELSELSGVTLRMIQAYEQGDQDIRRAEARAVLALARALGCRVEMLFG